MVRSMAPFSTCLNQLNFEIFCYIQLLALERVARILDTQLSLPEITERAKIPGCHQEFWPQSHSPTGCP